MRVEQELRLLSVNQSSLKTVRMSNLTVFQVQLIQNATALMNMELPKHLFLLKILLQETIMETRNNVFLKQSRLVSKVYLTKKL